MKRSKREQPLCALSRSVPPRKENASSLCDGAHFLFTLRHSQADAWVLFSAKIYLSTFFHGNQLQAHKVGFF
jgi:hypothetical protein